jgi:hypothetical protein
MDNVPILTFFDFGFLFIYSRLQSRLRRAFSAELANRLAALFSEEGSREDCLALALRMSFLVASVAYWGLRASGCGMAQGTARGAGDERTVSASMPGFSIFMASRWTFVVFAVGGSVTFISFLIAVLLAPAADWHAFLVAIASYVPCLTASKAGNFSSNAGGDVVVGS